jgi:hypothetical protein
MAAAKTERIERYKLELFEHLRRSMERAIWEFYTLCEYDSNVAQTDEGSALLQSANEDFVHVRETPRRMGTPLNARP